MMTRTNFIKESTKLIQAAVKLNRIAIRSGIPELECEVTDQDDEDFRQGLYLLIDGAKPSKIEEIFSNKIMFEKNKYARQYKTILKRSLLAILEREKTDSLIEILISYVGLSKSEEQKLEGSLYDIFVNFPLEEVEGGYAFDELTRLDDRAIQNLLREVDSLDLAKAMKGAGKQARDRIFGNLSKRAQAELSEEMDYMGSIDLSSAEEARQKIIALIKQLEQSEAE
jgi:flagellar motor switch protein FliG